MTIDWQLVFYFAFAGLAVVAAVGVLVCKSPIHCALCMVSTMVALAVIFLLHHAEFIAFVQIMVYAGAVMMLMVYVIMLLDLKEESAATARITARRVLGGIVTGALLLALLVPVAGRIADARGDMDAANVGLAGGGVEFLADKLFTTYLLPFEVASVVLLVGLVGAVALAKKRL